MLEPHIAALAVLLALAIDRWYGEPPAAWHPVVWMGRLLGALGRHIAPPTSAHMPPQSANLPRTRPFVLGALAWTLGAVLVTGLALALQILFWHTLPAWACALTLGMWLKPLFAWRMLRDEVGAVEAALQQSLVQGRERLSWLCSRDVSQLTEAQVRETAIETLAENLNDSVVAPLFWFAVAGLPGAALYRWANTADAMWGYRGERGGRDWTWAGKWAARADDALSWLPARLTGVALMLLSSSQSRQRWGQWWRETGITPSPNGGWPMAAMALALGVQLGKPGVYVLNASAPPPCAPDTARAQRLAAAVVVVIVGMAGLALLVGWASV